MLFTARRSTLVNNNRFRHKFNFCSRSSIWRKITAGLVCACGCPLSLKFPSLLLCVFVAADLIRYHDSSRHPPSWLAFGSSSLVLFPIAHLIPEPCFPAVIVLHNASSQFFFPILIHIASHVLTWYSNLMIPLILPNLDVQV